MAISDKPLLYAQGVGLKLPEGYVDARSLGLVNLMPWQFLSDDEFDSLFSGLATRYAHHEAIPFARRRDNDDVACFIPGRSGDGRCQIAVIHDFATSGHEVLATFDTFWGWFQHAVAEMIEWHQSSD